MDRDTWTYHTVHKLAAAGLEPGDSPIPLDELYYMGATPANVVRQALNFQAQTVVFWHHALTGQNVGGPDN